MGKAEPSTEQGNEASAPEGEKSKPARTRRTKAERFPKNIKILVDQITIPDEVLTNPDDWDEICEEHHDKLDVIKAEIFWRRTVRKKFVHKTDKAQPPVIAPAPLPSIPGTLLAPTLAAQIDKHAGKLEPITASHCRRRAGPLRLTVDLFGAKMALQKYYATEALKQPEVARHRIVLKN